MPMTFEQLKDFLANKMRMSQVYQPVLIRTLVESGGAAAIRHIAQAFVLQDERQLQYYEERVRQMPVRVLKNHGVVECDGDIIRLTVPKLSPKERAAIVGLCERRLQEYKERRTIVDSGSRHIGGAVVTEVFKAAKHRCAMCGATRDDTELHIDHIVPRSLWDPRLGDVNDVSNLQVLCKAHNLAKSNRDDTDFRILPATSDPKCKFCDEARRQPTIASAGEVVAFKDTYPVTEGHTLVIPKRHVENYFELTEQEHLDAIRLIRVLKNQMVRTDVAITGFNVGVNAGRSAGQTVMHCHFHLIPRRDGDMADPQGGVRGVIPERRKYR